MSKHSKWAKIKRQKGATDVKRGIVFSKLSRAITIAAKEGADPDTNYRLRMAIDRALNENMPKDNIERAVEKARGGAGESALETLTIEARGLGGSALLIDAVTDNRNRSFAEIRKILGDFGCAVTEPGSMQWLFEKRGQILIENAESPETAEMEAIDAGALDIETEDATVLILTPPEALHSITEIMKNKKYKVSESELIMQPKTNVVLPEPEYDRLRELIDTLENHEDVVSVTSNAEIQQN